MRRPPFVLLLLLVAALGSIRLGAQSPSAPPPAEPPQPATAPARPRAVSPETAAKLAAALPKVAVANPAAKKPEAESPDLREIDKPSNGIVRLPKYIVQEQKPPVFRERDLYTQQAFARRLAKRYYSEGYLAFSNFARYTPLALFLPSAEASALQQFYDDERLKNMADVADHANMLMKSNPAAAAKLKSAAQDTFMHWSDFGWNGGSPH
jgi:hypothetical protein